MGVVQWAWSSGCSPVGFSQDESVEHKGSQRCGLEGNSGCGLEGSLGAVQWKATDLETISGCGPVGKDHCKSLGEFWRESMGVV